MTSSSASLNSSESFEGSLAGFLAGWGIILHSREGKRVRMALTTSSLGELIPGSLLRQRTCDLMYSVGVSGWSSSLVISRSTSRSSQRRSGKCL